VSARDPFVTLGIAPTLDSALVKRAYFTALAEHPPHRDPDGFARVRAAYEALSSPGSLAAAYLASPLDLEAELARYRERFDAALASIRDARRAEVSAAAEAERFADSLSRARWADVLKA
jgi:curved DNA-binding protein CbpA